jgi:hypothetical protein
MEAYTANTVEILLPQNIFSTASDTPSDRWICDTGADVHFTASPSNFIPGTARSVSILLEMEDHVGENGIASKSYNSSSSS